MRMPQKKRAGDKILAGDWNLLIDAIEARTPRPGAGLELIASSGGFAYSKKRDAVHESAYPPFAVIAIGRNGTAYKVTVQLGWVIERLAESDTAPAVKFWMPTYAGTRLDAIPRPQFAMSINDFAWCKIETDSKGVIKSTPTIYISATNQNGTHYNPTDPDASGGDGTYYVKLFKLVSDGGTPAIECYQRSDIEHWAQLWTGQNVGAGSRIFKEYAEAENAYKFRTILAGLGIKITENANDVEIETDLTGINCYLAIRRLEYQLVTAGGVDRVMQESTGYGEVIGYIKFTNGLAVEKGTGEPVGGFEAGYDIVYATLMTST